MRTTLDIDEKLIADVQEATGEKSKSRAVSKVLEDYIRQIQIKELLNLQGRLDLDLDDWYEFRHEESDTCPR